MSTTTQIIEAIDAQIARMADRDRAYWRNDLKDALAAYTVLELRNVLIAKFKPMTGHQNRDDVVAAVLDLYVPEEADTAGEHEAAPVIDLEDLAEVLAQMDLAKAWTSLSYQEQAAEIVKRLS